MLKKIIYLVIASTFISSKLYAAEIKFEHTDEINIAVKCNKKTGDNISSIIIDTKSDVNDKNKRLIQIAQSHAMSKNPEESVVLPSIVLQVKNLVKEDNKKLFDEYCEYDKYEKEQSNKNLNKKLDNMEIKKIELESISIPKDYTEDYKLANFLRNQTIKFTYTVNSSDYKKNSKLEKTKIKKQKIIIFFNNYEIEKDKLLQPIIKKLKQITDHHQIYSMVISALNSSYETEDNIKDKIKTLIPEIKKIHKKNQNTYKEIKEIIDLNLINTKKIIIENSY